MGAIKRDKYRCFDVDAVPLGDDKMLIHSRRAKTAKILSTSQAQMLLGCRTSETLYDHVQARCQEMQYRAATQDEVSLRGKLIRWAIKIAADNDQEVQVRSKKTERAKRWLSSFVDDGFLVSEADLLDDLHSVAKGAEDTSETPITVRSLGIATCNRPEYLRRSAASYLENAKRYGKDIDLVIIDDSTEERTLEANRDLLARLKSNYDTDVFYADRRHRARFARRLADHADVPREIAEFSLLGDDRYDTTYGASANAIFLHTFGEAMVLSDDDVVCKMAAVPDQREYLALSSEGDPNEFWFFEDHDSALESLSFIDGDFFGSHERLLGQIPTSYIASAVADGAALHFGKMSANFLRNLHLPAARVVVTYTGIVGDSGAKDTSYLLFTKGNTFERLVGTHLDYQTNITTHQILRTTRQATICDGVYCMSTAMGLDNRTPLPPFMSIQGNCDGVFGFLLKACFRNAYRGFMPRVLLHDSQVHRVSAPSIRQSIRPPRVNDLLQWIILVFGTQQYVPNSANPLQPLGSFLTAWGRAPANDFEDFVRTVCFRNISMMLRQAKRRIEERRGKPAYWAKDMKAMISAYENLLSQKYFFVPSDLEGNALERMALFREVVYKFGQLLVFWPAMLEAAKVLRRSGQGFEELQV